jgi:hypothetical protein
MVGADDQRRTTNNQRLIKRPSAAKWCILALEGLFCNLLRFFSGTEQALFVASDALMRVQTFEHKFGR